MARLAEAICGLAPIAGRRISLRTAGGARLLWQTAALRASSPIPASTFRRTLSCGTGTFRRSRTARLGAGGRARGHGRARRRKVAVSPHLGHAGADRWLSVAPSQRLLLAGLSRGIRRHLRTRRIAARPTVYVCAQDRDDAETADHSRATERVFCLVNAPANATRAPLSAGGDADMRASDVPAAGEVRPADPWDRAATCRTTPEDFARLYPVERRERCTAGRRTAGGRRSRGRGRRRGFRASIWRAAACIRDLGSPMAALSGRHGGDARDARTYFDQAVDARRLRLVVSSTRSATIDDMA